MISYELANLSWTIADNNVDNLWFMSVFLIKLSFSCSDEVVVNLNLNEVDSATTEATAHDTATSNTILLS